MHRYFDSRLFNRGLFPNVQPNYNKRFRERLITNRSRNLRLFDNYYRGSCTRRLSRLECTLGQPAKMDPFCFTSRFVPSSLVTLHPASDAA